LKLLDRVRSAWLAFGPAGLLGLRVVCEIVLLNPAFAPAEAKETVQGIAVAVQRSCGPAGFAQVGQEVVQAVDPNLGQASPVAFVPELGEKAALGAGVIKAAAESLQFGNP
jgi:hypothetical protein